MKLEKWVKNHNICPAFKQLMDGCKNDYEYYERVQEPEYFLFGISERNKQLCSKTIKAAILKSAKKVKDENSVFHIKKACLKNVPVETCVWLETKKKARQLSTLERAAYKFMLWKRGKTAGQFAGGIAVMIVRANAELGEGKDAKNNFMTYLKENISYEQWSKGL